jgi:hypothetical protein
MELEKCAFARESLFCALGCVGSEVSNDHSRAWDMASLFVSTTGFILF